MYAAQLHLRFGLVLIHHDDEDRVVAARRAAGTVREVLEEYGEVEYVEVSRQPVVIPVPLVRVAARRLRQWWLERRWAAYLGRRRRWILSTGVLALRLLELLSSGRRAVAGRRAFVENVLTDKHYAAWRFAFDRGLDALLVLEDDARAHPETATRLHRALDVALHGDDLANTYFDLAGGLSRRDLRLEHLVVPAAPGVLRISRAATNTTCAYLLGSEVVSLLVAHGSLYPEAARLAVDWYVNAAFLDGTTRGVPVRCLHAEPTVLDHGSTTGHVRSAVRGS